MARFWRRKPPAHWDELYVPAEPEGMVADRVEEEPVAPQTEGRWNGPVCFGASGWFHPVEQNEHGEEVGPDLSRRLIHNVPEEGEAFFEFAKPEHRDHKSHWELRHPRGSEQVLEQI